MAYSRCLIMRNKPRIRFKGFTEDWEQRKLNAFLSVSNLKNTENKYNKKDVLSVSGDYGIVNQIEFQGRSFAGASVSNYGVVEKGDIVYTKSPLKLNPYGIIKTNRINNGIVSTLYAIYKTKENCDAKFIEHYFNLDSRLNQYLKPLVNKGAKNDMKVSSENALVGEVCFPQITEQAMIADLLDCLDIYITLYQRKLEKLKLAKKALLQKLFPKNGSQFPEIRFKGFTDAWEQRKLKSITNTIVAGGDIDKTKIKEIGTYPVIANALTKEGIVGYYNDDYRIEAPAVTVTGRGDIGVAKARHQNFTPVVRLLSLTTAHDVDFIEHAINNLKIVSESTGVPQLTVPQLSNYKIHITSIIEEQKIGGFISKLDNLITLHQCKLNKLQDVEKGLLQKMFV